MVELGTLQHFYEVYDYRNAYTILSSSHPDETNELFEAFLNLRIPVGDIVASGGNESNIPKQFSSALRSKGWVETRISADLLVHLQTTPKEYSRDFTIENFIDGHKIDYIKNRVAFDLEWNSKDQTFDRDLYAFAAFYQANIIDAAVLVTRSESLNPLFKKLGVMSKYGASTTWMGKLTYRMSANRSGGCPVLALGITPKLIEEGSGHEQ